MAFWLDWLDKTGLQRAQETVTAYHYLRRPVDTRSTPQGYSIMVSTRADWRHEATGQVLTGVPHGSMAIGYLIFGRPEATRCYDGKLTYGSNEDVKAGRAKFDRWELLNLARVWVDPRLQPGGVWFGSEGQPGFLDRNGHFRSTLASWAIDEALRRVGNDYLTARPPCFLNEPYEVKRVMSYCDTRVHTGTLYRVSGFERCRRNSDGIETWARPLTGLTPEQDVAIRKLGQDNSRSRHYRAKRWLEEYQPQQLQLDF